MAGARGGGATRKGSWDESLQAVEILGQVDGGVFNQINTLKVSSQAGKKPRPKQRHSTPKPDLTAQRTPPAPLPKAGPGL